MTKIGNVWVFIEQEGGKIADVSLELVCKGKELASKLGVKVEAVLLGNNVAHCADTLFRYGVKTGLRQTARISRLMTSMIKSTRNPIPTN